MERELETIIVREKPTPDESARQDQPSSEPPARSIAASLDARKDNGSKALPVVSQSSIVPLIETGTEHLYVNRPSNQPQPTIHVTIGRIEVRAVQSSQSAAKPRQATPVMNLDDYLRRRSQGGAR